MTTGASAYVSAKGLGENIVDKTKELYVINKFLLLRIPIQYKISRLKQTME